MRSALGVLLAGQLLALPAAGQVTTQCANVADPGRMGAWSISSEPALPQAFQPQNEIQAGETFAAVAGTSATDVWAVGGDSVFGAAGESGNGIVYHFDGTRWCRVNDPDLQNPFEFTGLDGVAALAPDNAWAVGSIITPSPAELLTIIQHWDGRQWRTVPSPDPGDPLTVGGVLTSISAAAPNDIWAVGYYEDGTGNALALLAHYDGRSWTAVVPPKLPGQIVLLYRVFARAHDDVWAVGIQGDLGQLGQTLIEHFDGIAWTVVPSDNAPAGANFLTGVAATSANDAWAVGATLQSPRGLDYLPLTEHWDGARWRRVATPATGLPTNVLSGVAAGSAGDVWAAGYSSDAAAFGNGDVTALVERWTGSHWVIVPAAEANAPGSVRHHQVHFPPTTLGSALTDIVVFAGASAETIIASGQYNTQVAVPDAGGGTTKLAKRHPYSITTTLLR